MLASVFYQLENKFEIAERPAGYNYLVRADMDFLFLTGYSLKSDLLPPEQQFFHSNHGNRSSDTKHRSDSIQGTDYIVTQI